MLSRGVLAYRSATVMDRLGPRSGACPLSARELLGAGADAGVVLPLVRAPVAGVARGALVAAKVFRSVVGLAVPAGVQPGPWFEAVTRCADEVAYGLPILLSADLVVEGEGATDLEQVNADAWRLVDAGITHVSVDVGAVDPAQRGRVAGEVSQAIVDRGVSVEIVVPVEGKQTASRAAALFEEVARRGAPPDAAGVRCPAPSNDEEGRLQAIALARISQSLSGVPVIRRGPITGRALELLRGSPVLACEDGGLAADFALGILPAGLAAEGAGQRHRALEAAAEALPPDRMDHLEARAYGETLELIERLGARGSAPQIARALERRLVET